MDISLKLNEREMRTLLTLPSLERGNIMTALIMSSLGQEIQELNTFEFAIYDLIMSRIESDNKKSQARSDAGKKGGAPIGNTNATYVQAKTSKDIFDTNKNKQKQAKTSKNKQSLNEVVQDSENQKNQAFQEFCKQKNEVNSYEKEEWEEEEEEEEVNNIDNIYIYNDFNKDTKHERKEEIHNTSSSSSPESKTNDIDNHGLDKLNAKTNTPFLEIQEMYNSTCVFLLKVKMIDGNRKKSVREIYKSHGLDGIKDAFTKVAKSDYLNGENARNWKADFDWIMNASNIVKIIEGKYDNTNRPRDGDKNNIQLDTVKHNQEWENFKPSTARGLDDD